MIQHFACRHVAPPGNIIHCFRANKYLLLLVDAAYLSEKQQFYRVDRCSNPQSIALETKANHYTADAV